MSGNRPKTQGLGPAYPNKYLIPIPNEKEGGEAARCGGPCHRRQLRAHHAAQDRPRPALMARPEGLQ